MRTEVFSIAIVSVMASSAFADEPLPPAPAVPVIPAVDPAPAPAPAPAAPVAAPGTVEPASPWGSSPHVVAYRPPTVEDRTHRGLTLEFAMGGGSNATEGGTGAGTFAIGWWVHPQLALAFRATAVGGTSMLGGSLQYYAKPKLWLGAGAGQMSETVRVDFDAMELSAPAGFVRAGYNLGAKGGHTLYLSAEAQVTQFEGQNPMVLTLFALGYQLR